MKKLIIWDFDGVISNTESLWILSRMDLLNKHLNLNWDYLTAEKYLGGRSDKDKKQILRNLGISVDDFIWDEIKKLDLKKMEQGLTLTEGIENIFKLTQFDQCIATGGIYEKTKIKIEKVGIKQYFSSNKIFTVDLVKRGKPEPDLFLLAAEKMGYKPHDCIVIEDSVVGIKAAIQAGMNPVAFVKYNTNERIKEIKNMGLKNIFYDMKDIRNFLINIV